MYVDIFGSCILDRITMLLVLKNLKSKVCNVAEVCLSLAVEQGQLGHMLIDCCNLRFEFILGINSKADLSSDTAKVIVCKSSSELSISVAQHLHLG